MRATISTVVATVCAAAMLLGAAEAQKKKRKKGPSVKQMVGDYEVEFEEIANNCTRTGMSLRKGTVTLDHDRKKSKTSPFSVSIPIAAVMWGKTPKEGKFRVEAKRGPTAIRGVLGQFSASGRVAGGKVEFVYIAEYYTQRGKPLCTQSWNASGPKK